MAKHKHNIKITPLGYAAQSVTGSCNLIEFDNTKFLVECGGIQECHTPLANYRANKEQLSKIKPQELQYIFICHNHYDHIGLVPALYANGKCNARIIVPVGSVSILKEMWLDSAKIMERDCDYLSRKFHKEFAPFYTDADISTALSYIQEYPVLEMIHVTDALSFRYVPSGHICLACQLELYLKNNNHTSKVLVTSDLGNTNIEDMKFFVDKFQPVPKATIVIGESTYGGKITKNRKKDFLKDMEKIKSIILQYCVDNRGRVLFPTFSLDRTPFMMWIIYSLFKNDPEFQIPIIIDSPLAVRLLHHYSSILSDESKLMFDEMMKWKNFSFISEYEDSAAAIADGAPKVIVSAGGMLQSGRSVQWAQSIVPRSSDCIVFSGYCGEGTLGYKIKHSKEQKTVTIYNKILKNRCQMAEITSMSSHMQHTELVNYYSHIHADAIYLVHGDLESRAKLKSALDAELRRMCKTTKVKIANKSTVITL